MTENILDIRRLAEMPKTVGGQQLFIFVPLANAYEPGIASFSSQDFTVTGRSAMVTINTNKFVTLTKLSEELAKKVDKTTKINNKSLDKDIVIYASDVPMAANDSTSVLAKFGLVDAKIAKLEQDTTAVYRYRGSVNTYADLLSIWDSKIGTGSQKPRVGDTYDVKSLNMNYAFVDEVSATAPNGWDALGQLFVLTPATPSKIGGVKPDDMTIGVKEDGTIYAKPATNDKPGIVQPDGETMFIKNGKLSTNPNTDDRAYIQSLFDLYFKSVDYVFAGINPELELLENPVQVVINSDRHGYVNLDYSFDLVLGKNYHVKCTIGKLDGSVEDFEFDYVASTDDDADPTPHLVGLFYSSGFDENYNDRYIYVYDKYHYVPEINGEYQDDVYGENFSYLEAGDTTTAGWSYVTFTSIVQKEATSANLLKEPVVVTQEEIDAGGSSGVQKTLNKAIGLEIDKIYDLTIVQNGVETIVTAGTIDAKSMLGTNFSFSGIITFSGLNNSIIAIVMYDGVDKSSGEPVQADKAMIQFLPTSGTMGAFELTSIQEHTNLEDWSIPLVVTIDNPQKAPYYKYYNKNGSVFDGEGDNGRVKITGSYVIDGQAHSFEEGEYVQLGGGGALYVDCLIEEPRHHTAARFSIADGALGVDNAFTANYVTLLIDNASVDGSPISELRIDSITAE